MNKKEAMEMIDKTKSLSKEIKTKQDTYKANIAALKVYYESRKIDKLGGKLYSLKFSDLKNEEVDLMGLFKIADDIKMFLGLVSPKKTNIEAWMSEYGVARGDIIKTKTPTKYHRANFSAI